MTKHKELTTDRTIALTPAGQFTRLVIKHQETTIEVMLSRSDMMELAADFLQVLSSISYGIESLSEDMRNQITRILNKEVK